MRRSVFCKIAENEFELVYTVAVRKLIGDVFGSMQKFVDKILKAAEENDDVSIVTDLIVVFSMMANQSIIRDNHFNGGTKKTWTTEELEMLFSPADVIEVRDYIFEAINAGNNREVHSEDDDNPNAEAGR